MKNTIDEEISAPLIRTPSAIQRLLQAGWGRFLIGIVLLGAGYLAWALNLIIHQDWAQIIVPVYQKLFSAESGFISLDLRGSGYALLAMVFLVLTGILSVELLLPQEEDRWLKRLTALLLGFGFIGTVTTLLAAFFQLHFLALCMALFSLFLLLLFAEAAVARKRRLRLADQARNIFRLWRFGKEDIPGSTKKLLIVFCLVFFAILEYQALRLIEFDWDALIYHANLAKIMFNDGGIPVIAGPSAGLELSANYPPLFSSLGAYFYVFGGQFNDTYFRMLSPVFSLLTLMAVYKIGSLLDGPRVGAVAVVLLLFTPLYFSRSIYATNYLPAAAFLTAALLFFLKGFQAQQRRYWRLFGLMYGFALLTSTHALVFVPSVLILLLLCYRWAERRDRKRLLGFWLEAGLLALAIYGVWLLRNTIYVHNPIYPFGSQWIGGLHFDPELFNRTVTSIRWDSIFNYFGTYTPPLPVYLQHLFFNRSQFPVISLLLILGAMIIPFEQKHRGWTMVGLYILPVGLVFASTVINIFPRYFVLILPGCALIVALLLSKILDWGNFQFVTTSAAGLQKYRSTNSVVHLLMGILVGLMFLFPGNLAVVLGKQYGEADIYKPNYWKTVPGSQDVYGTLVIAYGEGVRAWEWLRPRLDNSQDRVASFENRTYYLTDRVDALFYLDGWEAKPLYSMPEAEKAFAYLRSNGVKYVLDPYWARNWDGYQQLPLNRLLGDPEYFPLIYDTPEARIYQVGRVDDPITQQSPLAINLSQTGWSQPEIRDGYPVRWVEKNNTTARVFVSYSDQMTLRVEYLDSGSGTVDFNVKKPGDTWDYSTHIILSDTNQWRTQDLKLPRIMATQIVEIGIFSPTSDFVMKRLSAIAN